MEEKIKSYSRSSVPIFRVLIGGAGGVGRTTFLIRLLSGKFVEDTHMNTGCQVNFWHGKYGEEELKILFYDLPGQERWRFMYMDCDFVKDSDAFLLFYDLTRFKSLTNLGEWIDIIQYTNEKIPGLLIGAKMDLAEDMEKYNDFIANSINMPDFENEETSFGNLNIVDTHKISNKDGKGVDLVFRQLCALLLGKGTDKEKLKTVATVSPSEKFLDPFHRKYSSQDNQSD